MRVKSDLERKVFLEFSRICPLAIDINSIMSCDPPAPDILCSLRSGSMCAFELAEIVDSQIPAGQSIAVDYSEYLRINCPPLPGIKDGVQVGLIFRDGLSKQQRMQLAQPIYKELRRVPLEYIGRWQLSSELFQSGLSQLKISRGEFAGVIFCVSPVTSIGDPVLWLLYQKFSKKYTTQWPIELLMYYDRQPRTISSDTIDLASAIDEGIVESPFRRVWVLERRTKRVREYPRPSDEHLT